ncbi:hypothetical protein AYO44_08970 [Planctomycetaceae bacterium SCGC AG-212-F19]|nr:hypothetical protein AYO44_08970 [Planctomycetaceae bacterium SCGC AG-212-F19]
MDENLVGYLLHALDGAEHQQIEAYLRDHPEAQKRLETLRRALDPLAADRDPDDLRVPPALAFRTLARVAEYRCRPVPELPIAPPPAVAAGPPERRWWRRVDMLIAAAIAVVTGSLLFEGVGHFRASQARLDCANNMRTFHQSLLTFANVHNGAFPGVPFQHRYPDPEHGIRAGYDDPRLNVAGIFMPELRQTNALAPDASIRCPGVGNKILPQHTIDDLVQLRQRSPEEFDKAINNLAGCYAYSLGYIGPNGLHTNLYRDPDSPELANDLLPIMADKPAPHANGTPANSANHPGGQNVLHVGGHVTFRRTPNAGIDGDHIYLNRDGKVAAGLDRWDTVLGSSADRP